MIEEKDHLIKLCDHSKFSTIFIHCCTKDKFSIESILKKIKKILFTNILFEIYFSQNNINNRIYYVFKILYIFENTREREKFHIYATLQDFYSTYFHTVILKFYKSKVCKLSLLLFFSLISFQMLLILS